MKRLVRLVLGWVLMLAGVLLLLDSVLPAKSYGRSGETAEALAGFALATGGWYLSQVAVEPSLL